MLAWGCGGDAGSGGPSTAADAPGAAGAGAHDDAAAEEPAGTSDEAQGLSMLDTGQAAPGSTEPSDGAAADGSGPSATARGPVALSIEITPAAVLTTEEAKQYSLKFRIKNTSQATMDAPWGRATLLLNGRPMTDWQKLRDSLPARRIAPSESVEFAYRPGNKAVVKPGVYEFVLEVDGVRSDKAALVVSEQ
jgi:hypothetical protein